MGRKENLEGETWGREKVKRERLKRRGRGESKAGAGLTVIALCWKQQDTNKPWPALLLLLLCPSPSIPLISPPSSLPLLLFTLSLRFCFTPSELRFTQLSASCYLFFTHTHTHTHTQTAVTTAVGPPVSGPHEIAWCFLSLFSRDRFDKTTLILLHHGDVQCYDNTLP